MKNQTGRTPEANLPSIVFRIGKGLFCVTSKDISTIMQLPAYEAIPDAPPCITGIFMHRNSVVEMYDLRSAFHLPTLNQEYNDFAQMLDDRKQDHIHWVAELERSFETGEAFTLATDPHKCALGKWYDQYPFGDDAASRQLKKINEPHRRLHQAANEAGGCNRNCAACTREECLQNVLKRVKQEAMQQILRLLDETKEIFRSTVYHEMVLLLEGSGLGIVVDEVLDVENLAEMPAQDALLSFRTSSLISKVKKSCQRPEPILELDFSRLLQSNR